MDISLPLLFYAIGFIFFILGFLEERTEKKDKNEEEKSDHLVIIYFMGAFIFFCVAGAGLFGIQDTIYDPLTSTWVNYWHGEYYPFGALGIGLGVFCALLVALKVIEIFSHKIESEDE